MILLIVVQIPLPSPVTAELEGIDDGASVTYFFKFQLTKGRGSKVLRQNI